MGDKMGMYSFLKSDVKQAVASTLEDLTMSALKATFNVYKEHGFNIREFTTIVITVAKALECELLCNDLDESCTKIAMHLSASRR